VKATRAEVRLSEIQGLSEAVVDLAALKRAGVVDARATHAKVVLSGKLERAVTLKGIGATKGAREAIAAAGGKLEE
jgi:large subunit ribosomal protein L15